MTFPSMACACGHLLSLCYCGDAICWTCEGPDQGLCPSLPVVPEDKP